MSNRTISTGTYIVEAPCPECEQLVSVLARLSSVLTVAQDDGPTLRLKLKGEAVPHSCHVRQVTIAEAIAEAAGDAFPDGDVSVSVIRGGSGLHLSGGE